MNKLINIIRKVLRWTPVVTIALIAMMAVGTVGYDEGDGSWLFVSQKGDILKCVLSQIGHGDWDHFWSNAIPFGFFGIAAEIMLKKKRYFLGMVAITIIVQIVVSFFCTPGAIGASGWTFAAPFICGAGVIIASFRAEEEGAALCGIFPVLLGILISLDEIKVVSAEDGIGHEAHLIGALTGFVMFAIIGIIGLIKGVKILIEEIRWQKRLASLRAARV